MVYVPHYNNCSPPNIWNQNIQFVFVLRFSPSSITQFSGHTHLQTVHVYLFIGDSLFMRESFWVCIFSEQMDVCLRVMQWMSPTTWSDTTETFVKLMFYTCFLPPDVATLV